MANYSFEGYSTGEFGYSVKDYTCTWAISKYDSARNFRSPAFTAECDDFLWYLELKISKTEFGHDELVHLILLPACDADLKMYSPVTGRLNVSLSGRLLDTREISGSFEFTCNELTCFQLPLFDPSLKYISYLKVTATMKYKKTYNIECSLSRDLERICIDENYSDMTISVKGKKYPVHRVILAASSKAFDAMFKNKMQESKENHIIITDINQDVFEELLHYIYTGNSTDKLEVLAFELLPVAVKYRLYDLKRMCERVLCKKLSADNAGDILMLADKHNASLLKTDTIDYIMQNKTSFPDFKNTKLWKILCSSPELMKDVLAAFFE